MSVPAGIRKTFNRLALKCNAKALHTDAYAWSQRVCVMVARADYLQTVVRQPFNPCFDLGTFPAIVLA
jgi:hypothetical protein